MEPQRDCICLATALALLLEAHVALAGALVGQVYACYTHDMTPEEAAEAGITVVSHTPWVADPPLIKRCHELGLKVLPYISAEKAGERVVPGTSPYFRAVSPAQNREWIMVRGDGRGMLRYGHWVPNERGELAPVWRGGMDGFWYMCPNCPGYVAAVIRGVKGMMDLGVDGLFVDNVSTQRLTSVGECHGPRYGIHQHLYPEAGLDGAYTRLVHQIAATVKSYGQDKIVLLNGGLEDAFADCRDGGMVESYIVSTGQGQRTRWKTIAEWAQKYAQERAQGRAVTVLPYFDGQARPALDDAYYVFACSQYSGFLFASQGTEGRPFTRLHLGEPTGEMLDRDGVAYRVCSTGVVAINHSTESQRVRLPAPPGYARIVDFHRAVALPVANGTFEAEVPADSGRVYARETAALAAYLAECRFHATRKSPATPATPVPPPDSWVKNLAALESRVRQQADPAVTREQVVPLPEIFAHWRA